MHTNCGIAPVTAYEARDKHINLFALNFLTCKMRKDHLFRGLPITFPQGLPSYHPLQTMRGFKNVNNKNKKQGWEEESISYLLNPANSSLFSILVWIFKSPPKAHVFQARTPMFRDWPFGGDWMMRFWACEWIHRIRYSPFIVFGEKLYYELLLCFWPCWDE